MVPPDGVLIAPQKAVASEALDQSGAKLREHSVSLEGLIEVAREDRDVLMREHYGIEPAAQPDQGVCANAMRRAVAGRRPRRDVRLMW